MFYIQRKSSSRFDKRPRYATKAGGWSVEFKQARPFATRAAAEALLRNRPGEVIALGPAADTD